jgi:hypothetical protein
VSGKGIGIGVVVALAVAGAAYGAGRFQGKAQVEDADRRAALATSASASAMTNANVLVDIERGKVARLEARRRLHIALLALEDKNFGIAQEHLTAARGHLAAAKGGDNEMTKIGSEIEQFKVPTTEDLTEPKKKILEWCKRLDEAMPPTKP